MSDQVKESNKRYRRYYTYVEPIVSDPLIRGYFGLIASIFLIAFFIIFALSPTITTVLGLIRKIDDQKKVIATMDEKINNIISAQENYSQIEPSLSLLYQALPEKPNPEVILNDIVNTASASSVGINILQFSVINYAPAPGEQNKATLGLPSVQFTAEITGSESQVKEFLGRLEHLPRLINLLSISFQSQEKSSSLVANVKGLGYYELSKKIP